MIFKFTTSSLLIFSFSLLLSFSLYSQNSLNAVKTVCIDAGHGGNDPGAIGVNGTKEKEITLKVALKVGELIKKAYPNLNIIYTRNKDVSVDLKNRTKIANKCHADLFLSIHANSCKSKSVRGIETFVLGSNSTAQNLAVAMKENEAIRYEADYTTKYEGFDPNKAESYIIFNLMQNIHLEKSLNFASCVQTSLTTGAKKLDRDVRQAPFWVLKDAAMPSILVEIGYISNPDEERELRSDSRQNKIANDIASAFSSYKKKCENSSKSTLVTNSSQIAKDTKSTKSTETLNSSAKDASAGVKSEKKITNGAVKSKNNAVKNGDTTKVSSAVSSDKSVSETKIDTSLCFAIQVASSVDAYKSLSSIKVKEKIYVIHYNGRYRYYVRPCNTYDEVIVYMPSIKKSIKDCFPIAISQGKLIPLSEAKQIKRQ